jgi:uncharacterized membrane protein YdbT with pleckstrin-like domain
VFCFERSGRLLGGRFVFPRRHAAIGKQLFPCGVTIKESSLGELPMSYVQKNLNAGENIVYTTRLHWIVLLRPILLDLFMSAAGIALLFLTAKLTKLESQGVIFFGGLLILVGNLFLAIAIIKRNATEMAVTNKRVIIKVGYLTKRTIELFLSKVESVEVEQPVLGRIFGYGSIALRGTGGTNEPFDLVADPLEFRRQVQHQIEVHTTGGAQAQ